MFADGLSGTEGGRGQLWGSATSKVLKEKMRVFCSIHFTDIVTSVGLIWKGKNNTFLNKGNKT